MVCVVLITALADSTASIEMHHTAFDQNELDLIFTFTQSVHVFSTPENETPGLNQDRTRD